MRKYFDKKTGRMAWAFTLADLTRCSDWCYMTGVNWVRTGALPGPDLKIGGAQYYSESLAATIAEKPLDELVESVGGGK